MKPILPNPEHEVAYQDLVDLVRKHADKVDAIEMLAIAANMLGKLVAMQDQRAYTSAQVMEMVAKNIEHGNLEMVKKLEDIKEPKH